MRYALIPYITQIHLVLKVLMFCFKKAVPLTNNATFHGLRQCNQPRHACQSDRSTVVLVGYTGCFTTLGHNCRR
jgi:hypothetical protein